MKAMDSGRGTTSEDFDPRSVRADFPVPSHEVRPGVPFIKGDAARDVRRRHGPSGRPRRCYMERGPLEV